MRLCVLLASIAVVAGLGASLTVLTERARAESGYRAVELVVDYDEAAALAGATGASVAEVLQALREAGATGVGIPEDSLASLMDSGRAELGPPVRGGGADRQDRVQVLLGDAETAQRVRRNLAIKWSLPEPDAEAPDAVAVPGALRDLASVGVGWDERRVSAARGAGLRPIARPLDSPVISAQGIATTFDELIGLGLEGVLFQGKFVLGNSALISETARQIEEHGVDYYAVELDVQEGTQALSQALGGRVIRTHSIAENELKKMTPDIAVGRFARGVRERNIRCCFVRLFLDRACADALQYNCDYVRAVRDSVVGSGYLVGGASPVPELNPDHRSAPLIGLGVAGGVSLLALQFLGAGFAWAALSVLAALVCVGLPAAHPVGCDAVALLGALAFPLTAAFALRLDRPGGSPVWRPAAGLALATLVSTVGGLLVSALISDTLTLAKVDQFRGVKIALFLPVAVVAAVYGMQLLQDDRPLRARLAEGWARARRVLAIRVTLGGALVAMALAGAAGYAVLRSGNAGASAMSGLERTAREALEFILVYRPRTKEFLIGHPALVLAAYLAARGRTLPALLLGVAASAGLTSVVNTFCHIHTPLEATLLRTLFGVVLGGLLGLCAVLAVAWALKVRARGAHA